MKPIWIDEISLMRRHFSGFGEAIIAAATLHLLIHCKKLNLCLPNADFGEYLQFDM